MDAIPANPLPIPCTVQHIGPRRTVAHAYKFIVEEALIAVFQDLENKSAVRYL